MEKKIIILSRVSTAAQSLESQTNELINQAVKLGYDKKHQIIIEDVESAIKLSEEERMGLKKLKSYILNDKDIDCVICWEPSRLSRQQKTLYSIRDFLVEHKIQLYILNPFVKLLNDDRTQIDTTASIVFSLFSTIAENEMMIKKERFMRAKNELQQQGKKSAGAVIFGYMKDKDKKCVPHPLHSKIIIDIFRHYIEDPDTSLYETYQYASRTWPELFPIREYKKSQHKIRHFFEIDVYSKGNWCYPPLVTEEMHNLVREKMHEARCKPRYQCKRELLCRGKIYCGHCGRMMTGSGGNVKAYCCSTDKLHSLQINWDAMDWLMWEDTRSVINLNAAVNNNQKIEELTKEINNKQITILQIQGMIDDLNNKEEKLLNLYLEGNISKDLLDKRINENKSNKDNYQKQYNKLQTEIDELRSILEDTQKDLLNYKTINVDSIVNFENRLEFVRKYIDKVVATKEEDYVILEFSYKAGTIISQIGLYKYKNLGGWKHIWRINQDGTEDLILNAKKIG